MHLLTSLNGMALLVSYPEFGKRHKHCLIRKFRNSRDSYGEYARYSSAGEVAAFEGAPANDADQLCI
jgi:hypothetical protein